MATKEITGYKAINLAARYGLTLSKHADPTEGERHGLTVDEAREIAAEDPSLVYVDAAGDSVEVGDEVEEGAAGAEDVLVIMPVEFGPDEIKPWSQVARHLGVTATPVPTFPVRIGTVLIERASDVDVDAAGDR